MFPMGSWDIAECAHASVRVLDELTQGRRGCGQRRGTRVTSCRTPRSKTRRTCSPGRRR